MTNDTLLLDIDETKLYVDNETPEIQIEPENNGAYLEEMETAYRYELWRCWQILQEIKVQTTKLEQALEEITPSEVHAMWIDTE